MNKRLVHILFLLFYPVVLSAQTQHTDSLGTISIIIQSGFPDTLVPTFHFKDSSRENTGTLSELLHASLPFQIREYGKGMVSGISLQGGSPSQVQVVWNDIPLNSPLNGQTDLNTLNFFLTDEFNVYEGGASLFYGSGAMTGAIILRDNIRKSDGIYGKILLNTGQYGRYVPSAKIAWRNRRWALKGGIYYQHDDNNFQIPEKHYINENARILHRDYTITAAYRLNGNNKLEINTLSTNVDRELPGTLMSFSDSRLINNRQLWRLHWDYGKNHWKSGITAAFIKENYAYFYHKNQGVSGFGQSYTRFAKWHISRRIHTAGRLEARFEWQRITATGKNIQRHIRNGFTLASDYVFSRKNFSALAGIRMEKVTGFRIPPALFVQWNQRISPKALVSLNLNTGYRIPTFNDLYWSPGGNPHLKTESNRGISALFKWSPAYGNIIVNLYSRFTRNLIKWRPGSDNLWHPVNIGKVTGTGAEIYLNIPVKLGKNQFKIAVSGAYQRIIDLHTRKQLIYTPEYISTSSLVWQRGKFKTGWSARYEAPYYTDPGHYSLHEGYLLHNMFVSTGYKNWTLRFEIENVMNTYYELMPARPMPGRILNLNLMYKIKTHKK